MYKACHDAIHVVTKDGKIMRAGKAIMFLLQHLGFPILGRIGSWPPFLWAVEFGYFIVARNRKSVYRWLMKGICQKIFDAEVRDSSQSQ